MPREKSYPEVPVEKLRWRLDPATLPFETTSDLKPLKEIIGQKRGVEALRFGAYMNKPGYNIFVTGKAGTGRLTTVRRLLQEMAKKDQVPDDLCYVNNFKNPEVAGFSNYEYSEMGWVGDGAGGNSKWWRSLHEFTIPGASIPMEMQWTEETKGFGFLSGFGENFTEAEEAGDEVCAEACLDGAYALIVDEEVMARAMARTGLPALHRAIRGPHPAGKWLLRRVGTLSDIHAVDPEIVFANEIVDSLEILAAHDLGAALEWVEEMSQTIPELTEQLLLKPIEDHVAETEDEEGRAEPTMAAGLARIRAIVEARKGDPRQLLLNIERVSRDLALLEGDDRIEMWSSLVNAIERVPDPLWLGVRFRRKMRTILQERTKDHETVELVVSLVERFQNAGEWP